MTLICMHARAREKQEYLGSSLLSGYTVLDDCMLLE